MGLIGDIFKGISSKNAANAASGALQGGAKAALTEEQKNQQDAIAAADWCHSSQHGGAKSLHHAGLNFR